MLTSHLFQFFLTVLVGSALFFLTSAISILLNRCNNIKSTSVFQRLSSYHTSFFPRWFIQILILCIFTLISISFIFDIGEVYQYNTYYKRAFANLSDDIPIIISIICIVFLLSESLFFFALSVLSLSLTGGKIAIIALLIGIASVLKLQNYKRRKLFSICIKGFGIAIIGYFIAIGISNDLAKNNDDYSIREILFKMSSSFGIELNDARITRNHKLRGENNCITLKLCYQNHIKNAVSNRFISSAGGVWMTLQGGFPGKRYPSTPEAFADLMIEANPFSINTRFNITRDDWLKMPPPQNAYARFGSGYGYYGLAFLLLVVFMVLLMGLSNLKHGESGAASSLTIGFMMITIIDQTQPWTVAGSYILVALGFCSTHIIISYIVRTRIEKN